MQNIDKAETIDNKPTKTAKPERGKPCSRYKHKPDAVLQTVYRKLGKKMGSMAELLPQYKCAHLSVEADGWRIVFYNLHPQTLELTRVRKTCGLNRIKNETERRRVADGYIRLINEGLTNGYNYFIDSLGMKSAHFEPEVNTVNLIVALMQAMRIRTIGRSERTISSYESYLKRFTEWAKSTDIDDMPVGEFTAKHFYEYVLYKQAQGHGNKNINDAVFFIRSLFEIAKNKLHLVSSNPLQGIEALPETESRKFVPLTQQEIEQIVPALIAYSPYFYLYCKFVSDEYMRPHHIARLKSGDINYEKDELFVSGESTKNKRNTTKQLMHGLKTALLECNSHKVPGNHYLFSKGFKPGPNLHSSLSIRAAEVWHKIVRKGLGIDKHLYALKHTSAQYFVNNNPNIDVYYLRQQLEHSSARETEVYLQRNVRKKVKSSDVNTLKF